MTSAFHSQQLPPSGISHAVCLALSSPLPARSGAAAAAAAAIKPWLAHRGQPLCQLVTARDDLLRIYDVRQQTPSASSDAALQDADGARLFLVREHRIFGSITGLQSVSTPETEADGRQRLLVSFKDAKLALLEWSDRTSDLETVSIHTYERAPQLSQGLPSTFNQTLAVDPASRCAALLLPQDAIAVLPFYQDMSDLDFYDIDQGTDGVDVDPIETLPYSPSFVLAFQEVDAKIRDVKDFCFLPGFQKPTVAILFEQPRTWTGRLKLTKDTHTVYIFTLDLTASMAGQVAGVGGGVDGDAGLQTVHPILTTSTDLPYDCLYLVSCPAKLGGVMVVGTSSILHVDQSGRAVATAINDWAPLMSGATAAESTCEVEGVIDLHGSQLVFVDATEGILTLRDGTFCKFSCLMDGRSVGGIRLERITAPSTTEGGDDEVNVQAAAPSVSLVLPTEQPFLFNASMVGESTLFRCAKANKRIDRGEAEAGVKDEEHDKAADEMDLDLDDDLYGDSGKLDAKAEVSSSSAAFKQVLRLTPIDSLAAHGPILHLSTRQAAFDDGESSGSRKQIVACTGFGTGAGLTYFESTLAPRKKRRLDTRPSESIWSVGMLQDAAVSAQDRRASLLCSAEDEDVSELVQLDRDGSSVDLRELPGRTLAAGPLRGAGARWARITASGLHVLEADGSDVQTVAIDEADVVTGSIDEDEYASVQLSDGSFRLFAYDDDARQFSPLALPAELEGKHGACINVFRDRYGCLTPMTEIGSAVPNGISTKGSAKDSAPAATSAKKPKSQPQDDADEIDYGDDDDDDMGEAHAVQSSKPDGEARTSGPAANPTTDTSSATPANAYLFVLDTEAVCEIYSLPDLRLRWRSFGLPALADRLDLDVERPYRLTPEQAVPVLEARLCHLDDVAHIVVVTGNNLLLAYEANRYHDRGQSSTAKVGDESDLLSLGFNKVFSRVLSASSRPTRDRSAYANGTGRGNQDGPALKPFGWRSGQQDAVAVLGGGNTSSTSWLCSSRKDGLQLVDCDASSAPDDLCWLGLDGGNDHAACVDGSVYISEFDRGRSLGGDWTYQTFETGRSYTKVVSHDATRCIVAASVNEQQFVLYDEDNEPVTNPADDKTPTYSQHGALELFTDEDKNEPVHGWEFEANETVVCLELVTLDSPSVPGGRKKFIAAGTTVYQGEDRAAKGSTYLFDIIEVVPDAADPTSRFRLKLLCKDDSKAPVTAIADINGFIISTSGQKLYVRALEKEEWLISIAFMDLAFYVTSIRVLKNFILLSDMKKSLWFVGFQEDPYKFVVLGKDHVEQYATTGNFVVNRDRLSLVSTSAAGGGALGGKEGVYRMFEYAPMVASSMGGQRLLLKTEFQSAASEAVASYTVKGRWLSRHERRGAESVRSKVIYAMNNGSIETLCAVDEAVVKRLQLLQGQLVRTVRHFAALNPRGFRAVRNDSVSRPLVKGILDGRLVSVFASLPRPKMLEAVGTLSGLFNGLDEPHDADAEAGDEGMGDADDEEVERRRQERDEQRRRKREAKRADLILLDLVKLRAGFESM
ncbi:uncharacterized protein PFL1_02879 [Pseudozyma flocculosa PF-1]|uniref:Related to cleavage and polyadenylation specificity factor, 160 kDa subunit n=2 Tax=Pseudozyma flocculosa TaxID=84751 RepID=A0A5C3F3G9_9BASI|nr:uncharacterized protein PFL1_02879 [Pseudozyma flocculosa PF-1]EPQ29659.1 hypothetical protein PFL1_02879 [Pseudozyma flocculosa PF-1]SPO38227.1 related to cleavage and polyadenylation specificity factor, 160 kDa subunit [Pseudozyma flocculosa]